MTLLLLLLQQQHLYLYHLAQRASQEQPSLHPARPLNP